MRLTFLTQAQERSGQAAERLDHSYRAWWVMAAITALGLIPTFLLIRLRLPRVRDDQEAPWESFPR